MTFQNSKIPVALLGATGMVGQRMVERLVNHPWFELVFIGASERSAGLSYEDAVHWCFEADIPERIKTMTVELCKPEFLPKEVKIVFSALDSKVAGTTESLFFEYSKNSGIFIISNASNHRMNPNVPLLIPEVNPHHLDLLKQDDVIPTRGIITNPNCCVIPLALTLAPIHEHWGVESVCVATYQSVSGAGYPGESAWDMVGNVHPHPGNEELKISEETPKILDANIVISARAVRVPTADGHLLSVQIKLKNIEPHQVTESLLKEISSTLSNWTGHHEFQPTPSTPTPIIQLMRKSERARPSPRFDCNRGHSNLSSEHAHLARGMTVSVGRIEHCAVMGIKLFCLAHNTIRGAAGAALANAELLVSKGWVSFLGIQQDN
ncbi:MAG: aspartate-semialdehyde dehydrogenase [Proteobacteria bacterium]|nr:aspartate-semialdehyde dehydrogenase [Pseudomonadota bacterium]